MQFVFSKHEKAVAKGLGDAARNLLPAVGAVAGGLLGLAATAVVETGKVGFDACKNTVDAVSDVYGAYQQTQAQKAVSQQSKEEPVIIHAEVVD